MKKNFIIPGLAMIVSLGTISSCLEENESITEPQRYTREDVKSYADLFKIFWTVMDQKYNYFYEQKRKDGMDWDAIYKEYYPKFAALKSYNLNPALTDAEYAAEAKKANQYFTEIINPIIDRHFGVTIQLPASNSGFSIPQYFSGGMNDPKPSVYDFNPKYEYMKDRVQDDAVKINNKMLAGYLKSDPGIFYLSFNKFDLTQTVYLQLRDKYLRPDPGNIVILTPEAIENSTELNSITNIQVRNKVKNFTINLLNKWNNFPNSPEINYFNDQVKIFKETETLSDSFLETTAQLLERSQTLVAYADDATYADVLTNETAAYIQWFKTKIKHHVELGYNLKQFQEAAYSILTKAQYYKKILNPLHKGNIKKMILDLRSNRGGMASDLRIFTDRFITKTATAFYQRTKEGNGRFNYTPWVPTESQLHQFGIPKNIPIVILTDKNSASMSEMTTLMLKSQGNHVISIGDYSNGATAGLGSSDEYNGGIRSEVAGGLLEFTMPLMATKDANGIVIEGIGVKPDIYVTPPTDAELQQMKNSPATFADRVMEEAIKYISAK
ncbi:peptidase S41 [Chryseobacterium sp. Tr-659]|uniref:S41 family peptidase n=1 Tax=Chryseobacterium sp. Tr-659 TaxID=2608340 RepID=UPI001422F8C3|nr:S41 family peptidase [Chryseobacterium sp. Tr-659]NIF06255.1 peptidase S41 [Chryseobacterium sp. Tr-659]